MAAGRRTEEVEGARRGSAVQSGHLSAVLAVPCREQSGRASTGPCLPCQASQGRSRTCVSGGPGELGLSLWSRAASGGDRRQKPRRVQSGLRAVSFSPSLAFTVEEYGFQFFICFMYKESHVQQAINMQANPSLQSLPRSLQES